MTISNELKEEIKKTGCYLIHKESFKEMLKQNREYYKEKVIEVIDKFLDINHPYNKEIAAVCALKDVKKQLKLMEEE